MFSTISNWWNIPRRAILPTAAIFLKQFGKDQSKYHYLTTNWNRGQKVTIAGTTKSALLLAFRVSR